MGEDITKVSTIRGSPQGGILSSLMRRLVIDELLEQLSCSPVLGMRTTLSSLPEENLKALSLGTNHENMVQCSGAKCESSKNHSSTIYEKNQTPRPENSQDERRKDRLEEWGEISGIMFDKKLLWNQQVDYTVRKSKSELGV